LKVKIAINNLQQESTTSINNIQQENKTLKEKVNEFEKIKENLIIQEKEKYEKITKKYS